VSEGMVLDVDVRLRPLQIRDLIRNVATLQADEPGMPEGAVGGRFTCLLRTGTTHSHACMPRPENGQRCRSARNGEIGVSRIRLRAPVPRIQILKPEPA